MFRSLLITSILILGSAAEGLAQRAGQPGALTVSVKAGGKSYEGSGTGSCRHTPTAAIYNVPAALWMVEHSGSEDAAIKSLHLTLWRPKDGSGEQFSLNVTTRGGSQRIDVGGRGEQVGSGKVAFTPAPSGGRFEIRGKDQAGMPLEATISCPAFSGVEAEGG